MDKRQESSSTSSSVKSLHAVVSLILGILSVYKFVFTEWDWLSTALLISGVIFLWGFGFYVYFKQITIGTALGIPSKFPAYPKWQRRIALVVVILIPITLVAWGYYQSLPSKEIIVAIADFEGPDPQSYRVTEMLLVHLREVTKEYPEIRIVPIGRSISEKEGSSVAQDEGRKVRATLVIWGWYGKTEEKVILSGHFETLRTLRHSFPRDKDTYTSPASDLNSFRVQEDLSTRLSYLVLTTVGLISSKPKPIKSVSTYLQKRWQRKAFQKK